MRIFWIIVGLVVVLAGAFVVVPMLQAKRTLAAATEAERQATEARMAAESVQTRTAAQPQAASKPSQASSQTPLATTNIEAEDKTSQASKPATVQTVKPIDPGPAVETNPTKAAAASTDAVEMELQKILSGETTSGLPPGESGESLDASKKDVPAAAPVEKEMPKLESRPDGSLKLDDRFIIKGAGTKEDPYEVSWEHLVSIQETFDPAQKKDKIPGRLQYIDNTYVKITGYICFPLYVPQPKELLTMLNQWDGCCIGVPPTAYDAIEVQLRKKVNEELRFAVHGSVAGKFQVKPYVTGNWLVGLYLMTDAEFEPSQGSGN